MTYKAEKNQNYLSGLRQIMLRGATLFALTLGSVGYSFRAAAEASVYLPEPRYVEVSREHKRIGDRTYTVPTIKDQWDELAKTKAQKLHDILIPTDSCDDLDVGASGITCTNEVSECIEKEYTKDRRNTHYSTGDPFFDYETVTEESCKTSVSKTVTAFNVSYRELSDITKSSSFLGIGGDNLCFRDEDGKQHEIDMLHAEDTPRAVELLRELRYISQAMHQDKRDDLQATAREAKQAYEAAQRHHEYVMEVVQCVMSSPLKVSASIETCLEETGHEEGQERSPRLEEYIVKPGEVRKALDALQDKMVEDTKERRRIRREGGIIVY